MHTLQSGQAAAFVAGIVVGILATIAWQTLPLDVGSADRSDDLVIPEGLEWHDGEPQFPTRGKLQQLEGRWKYVGKDLLVYFRYEIPKGELRVVTVGGPIDFHFDVEEWFEDNSLIIGIWPASGGLDLMMYAEWDPKEKFITFTHIVDPDDAWTGPSTPFSMQRLRN